MEVLMTERVPDVVGRPVGQAIIMLRKASLRPVARVGAYDEAEAGTVLATDPEAGTEVETGSRVHLGLSLGPEPTVSEKLQAIVDGPRNVGNKVVIPPGDYELDSPLRITKLRTVVVREGVAFSGAVPWDITDTGSLIFDDEVSRDGGRIEHTSRG